MTNTYHAPDAPQPAQVAPEPHSVREENLTLERAAANVNLRLVTGTKSLKNPSKPDKPWKQPFWFVHDVHELTGVYIAAEMTAEGGTVQFKIAEAREDLRSLLVNFYSSGKAMGLSIIQFGGARGFTIKTANKIEQRRKR